MAQQTLLVTGASSGFGWATALRFVQAGWQVIAMARRADRLQALKASCANPDLLQTIAVDLADPAALHNAYEAIPDSFKPVDVLFNNAGLALGLEPAHHTQLSDWEQMVQVNIQALMRLTHHCLPEMVLRGRGYVINMGSVAGNWPYPGGNVYGASKAFVRHFSLELRADLLGTGVRVTNIEPGNAETEFSLVRFKADTERAKQLYAATEALTAEDIADTVWWLVNTPPHMNVTTLEIMPTHQANGAFAIYRQAD